MHYVLTIKLLNFIKFAKATIATATFLRSPQNTSVSGFCG